MKTAWDYARPDEIAERARLDADKAVNQAARRKLYNRLLKRKQAFENASQ